MAVFPARLWKSSWGCFIGLGFALAVLKLSAADEADSPVETNRAAATRPLGPVTVEEAKQASTNLNIPKPGPGTWRKVDVMDAMDILQTNVIYEWHGADGRRLVRYEETLLANDSGKNTKRQPQTSVTLRNEEGLWALHERVAILSPAGAATASAHKSGASTNTPAKRDEDELLDDPQIVTNMIVTGERIKEGDRVLLCVRSTMGEKAQQRLNILIDQKIKEAKKEAPLLLRPLLAAFPVKKMLLKMLPVRTDKVIDEETHTLVIERGYNRDGQLVMQEWAWTPCPDLPPESYQMSKSLKLLRPKTSDEADRLGTDARKEDGKLRGKSR